MKRSLLFLSALAMALRVTSADPSPALFDSETGEFLDIKGRTLKRADIVLMYPDGILYTIRPAGRLPQNVKVPFTWFKPEVVKWLKEREAFEESMAKQLAKITVGAVIEPFYFGESHTLARLQPYVKGQAGLENRGLDRVPVYRWYEDGDYFNAAIDEPMPKGIDNQSADVLILYRIGHTNDTARHPLFTRDKAKAIRFLSGKTEIAAAE